MRRRLFALCWLWLSATAAPVHAQQHAQHQAHQQNQQTRPALKILTTGAFKQVVLALAPGFESSTAYKADVVGDTAGALLKRIEAGEAFDLVFLTPAGLNVLAGRGLVDATSIRPVAKVSIGVAVRNGAPLPALETVDQFKAAVLAARKVAYIDPASGGSSGIYLDGLFQRLGIADAVRAKAVLLPGGLVAEKLVNGEADLAIHQISEILPVPGVHLVGALPAAIQNDTVYASAIAKDTRMAAAAAAFLALLQAPEFASVIQAKGMQLAQ